MLNMFISLGMRKSFLIKLKVIYAKRFVQDKYNQVLEVYGWNYEANMQSASKFRNNNGEYFERAYSEPRIF